MKKTKIHIFALLLVSVALFAGCKNSSTSNVDIGKQTSDYLIKSGRSEYQIVIPENATNYEQDAANELKDLIEEATAYTLPIVKDNGLSAKSGKYIAIGNTKLLSESGIAVDNDELGYSGYLMKTVGDDVYLTGSIGKNVPGTVYAAYGFLNKTLGFRQYTSDFYTLNKVSAFTLPQLDVVDIPDIDQRSLGYLALNTNPMYAKRMRLQQFHGATTSNEWVLTGHTMIHSLLNYESYGAQHPEWYCGGEGILLSNCLSNLELRDTMAQNIINFCEQNTVAQYIQVGMADNFTECHCELCDANRIKYGSYSGIQVDMMNYMSDIVTAWIEKNQPGRELKIIMFAYHWGEAPPVKMDENGKYVPYHEDLICRDNVGIMWAPVGGDFGISFTAPQAASYYNQVMGWNALTNVKTAYLYCIDFRSYLLNYNNFGSVQENYKFLAENGYEMVYDQANADDTIGGSFEDMRIYVQSRLLWDTDLNYEQLAQEFIQNVYGAGAVGVQKYYDITRSWLTVLQSQNLINGTIYFPLLERSLWPKYLVDSLDAALNEAILAIEPLKDNEPEIYTTLLNRIQRERLTTMYLNLNFYEGYYSEEAYAELISEFEHYTNLFNIRSLGEGVGEVSTFISSLKQ